MLINSKSIWNPRLFCLFFLILFSLMALSLSETIKCSEQWTEIELNETDWVRIGDASIEGKQTFSFGRDDTMTSGDFSGAVWNNYDFSQKKGLLISFKPTIQIDKSYTGKVKYPFGFAIIFTSSSTEGLIGEKGSGIGYEGIMNAVAFEFDFDRNAMNTDHKKPHFSVHYNVNGPISASSAGYPGSLVNKSLPNFYDDDLEDYYRNIIFEIQIIGNRIIVKSNRDTTPLIDTTFTQFQQLLEQEGVHIGITSTMNKNKKVTISNFKISEVSEKEKGQLESDLQTINAGEDVTLRFSIESTCGEKLKLYSNEYNGNDFILNINNKQVKPKSILFNDTKAEIEMVVTENIEDTYTATVLFRGHTSSQTKFIVKSSNVERFELCNVDKEDPYTITSELEQNKNFLYVPICSYDQFGNQKKISYIRNEDIKIKFPNYIVSALYSQLEIEIIDLKALIKIPISTFGTYEIFHENFIGEKVRKYEFYPKEISPEKSDLSILYGYNIINENNKTVFLRIKPRDNYGRNIPTVILKQLNCDFKTNTQISENTNLGIEQIYKDDYVLLKVNIVDEGKYTFVPKVQCDNIDLTEFYCGYDSETKINNCEFYYLSSNKNTEYIKAYSDYTDYYYAYKAGKTDQTPLIISLDEKDNAKLTEIFFLDENNSPYLYFYYSDITAKLESNDLEVVPIGHKFSILLSNMTRESFSSLEDYNLEIKVDSITFYIPIKFYFIDHFMNNFKTNPSPDSIQYIAFYKQNSFKLKAAETFMLFEIYELIDNKYLGSGDSLDGTKVGLIIDDIENLDYEKEIHSSFISIISHSLTKTGEYNIKIKYNENEILNINIEIIATDEAYYLGNENGQNLESSTINIGCEELLKLTLLDKYENILKDNQVFNAFAKISIDKFDSFMIKPNYDGKIHIIHKCKSQTQESVTIKFNTGNLYNIKSSYSPSLEDIDPLNSYGLFSESGSAILPKNSVKIYLILRDKFGNKIEVNSIENIKDKISVYAQSDNIKEITPLKTTSEYTLNGYVYTADIPKIGDYEVKIFYDNFPVECKGCFFRKDYLDIVEINKSILYLLGNKIKIPLKNSFNEEKIKVGLFNKNNDNFAFYYEQRDENLNEIKDKKFMSFNFNVKENIYYPFSSIGNNDEKGFFKMYSSELEQIKKLPDGLYNITKANNIFYTVYLTNSEIDTEKTTPNAKNSMILLADNIIYGKTDIPGSFILDIRTDNYKRIKNLDTSKIEIVTEIGENINTEIVEGPENGLYTVFLKVEKPGKYEFTVNYNSKKLIEEVYTYICTCGVDKKLKMKGNSTIYNGNYIFFELTDGKDNECYNLYNYKDIAKKEFGNYLIKASNDAGQIYKTETYFNHMTSTFIIYLNRHVSGKISLSSDLITIDESLNSIDLTNYILDENHFYVSESGNKLNIKALDDNYDITTKTQITTNDFDVALIRILNDDFVMLKNNFTIKEDFTVDCTDSNKLLDARGKYLYVVYYKGKEIFCKNCLIHKDEDTIDITKTKIYHKEGNNNYIQNGQNMILPLSKSNFPFFKINLMTSNNNLAIIKSGLTVTLKGDKEIQTQIKFSSNGNIYVYLEQKEREEFLSLPPMTKLNLKVTYSGSSYDVNYYVLNNYVEKPISIENCAKGAIPNIVNSQSLYMKRVDEELEIEIYLSGCATDELKILNQLEIIAEGETISENVNVIPTDLYGGYLLFLPNSIEISDKYYYILNKKSKSEKFELTVMPGYDIESIQFRPDDNMDETQSDKLYTYFFVDLKDSKGNTITNVGRNLFANDFYGIDTGNLPYKMIYDETEKAFRCQVPINGAGILNIQNSINDDTLDINIDTSYYYENSLFEFDSENQIITFNLKYKDDYYKEIKAKEEPTISFKYFTYNPLTNEIFIRDISIIQTESQGSNIKVLLSLEENFPKYYIYGFIPLINLIPQVCSSCFKYNKYPDYFYSIGTDGYIPHKIGDLTYLTKDYDRPIYLYLNDGSVKINLVSGLEQVQYKTNKLLLYILKYNGNSDKINVQLFDDVTLKEFLITFVDYNNKRSNISPKYIEKYSYNIYNTDILDNKGVVFFMEVRGSDGQLINNEPKLNIDVENKEYIKSIIVVNTCLDGVFYVKIIFNKSADIKYLLKLTDSQLFKNHPIHLKVISAFPNQIILNNKERINKRMISYNLFSTNANAEQICDERLNLYIDDSNLKSITKKLIYKKGVCSLNIQFYGDVVIKSNIDNFYSEITNNDYSLYNINPQFSSISISPNIFTSEDTSLTINFNEKSPSLTSYNKNEIVTDKKLYVYQYISPNKFKFIKQFSSLYASEYSYNVEKFNFKKGKIYVLAGIILNNIISPSFAYYNIEKLSTINSITGVYFTSDKKAYPLPEFSSTSSISETSFKLDIPFLLRVQFVDSNGETLDFGKDDIQDLKSTLCIIENNDIKNEINLIIKQYNDKYFFIKIDTSSISEFKNLPQTFTQSNSGYGIKIAFYQKEFYLFFSLKENNYQIPYTRNQYGYPLHDNKIENFMVGTPDNKVIFTTFSGIYNPFQLCFFTNSEIVNTHINKKDLSISLNNCEDYSFVNSYRGCISFSANCDKNTEHTLDIIYKNISSNSKITIKFKDYSYNNINFNSEDSTLNLTYNKENQAKFVFNTSITYDGNEYFRFYINGEKMKKYDLTVSNSNSLLQFSMSTSKYFDTIPKMKNIMITYDNGMNVIQLLQAEEISVKVDSKEYSVNSYNYYYQAPLNLTAGDIIYLYLIIKDKSSESSSCYYGDLEKLSGIEMATTLNNGYNSKTISNYTEINGYSECERIYLFNFSDTYEKSGYLPIRITDNLIPDLKLYISPKDIEESESSFYGYPRITAGQTAHLTFNGTDKYENKINYFDLLKIFDIKLLFSNGTEVDKDGENYSYDIKVSQNNSELIIDIKINIFDTFKLMALKNNKIMNLKQNFSLIVDYGNCSLYGAAPEILPIDNRTQFYPGEKLTVQIQCKDNLGNPVTKEGNEIFSANIKRNDEDLPFSYIKEFINGYHLISFIPTLIGQYTVNITLNGKKYGNSLDIEVQSINSSKYNCLDRRQVDTIEQCNTPQYREFLKGLLGETHVAYEEEDIINGTLFKCPSDDSIHVAHTKDCGCPNGAEYWNGFCYLKDYNPTNQTSTNKITCITKMKINDPNVEVAKCKDGTCRFTEEECNTTFECPIGYIPCGVKCILINETCEEKITCNNDEVLCWDLSCASGYDLCPTRITCPKNKVLCPDGSCQDSGHCIQPNKRTCEKNQYQCPDFTCVSNRNDCTKNKVCNAGLSLCENGACEKSCQEIDIPADKYRCSNGEYADSKQLCPSDMLVPLNYVKCPNGGIALNIESCKYVQKAVQISCPITKPILCPDFSCVEKSSECSSYIPSCPPHKPYKCWNNECRISIEECPTPVTCPKEMPILCQSGLCVRSVEDCREKVSDKCGQYRCFDGTCVASMELCPTHIYCGEGNIKCWNGACVTKIEDCRSSILEECPKDFKIRCPDGTCRKSPNDCSTISICPPHLPIKCYDNSCRASINECPNYQPCPKSGEIVRVSCPDGTCAISYKECNTLVTCFSNSPYLCMDNSCKAQLSDCPEPPQCSKNEFLCPDGSCVSNRIDCKIFECDSSNPIRCEMNICTDESSHCGSKTRRCPIGYILCPNGDCKTSEYLCDNFECPKNKPYFCKEGVCVHDPNLCDIQKTGCPYNARKKCPNGSCVKENEECPGEVECEEGEKNCIDGSCIDINSECPLINGCYADRPFKCADGTCINQETTNCSLVLCPINSPYKCPNGYCVAKSSDCSNYLTEDDLNDCGDGLIMCIDGRCVESTDYCRPSFECESGYTKCSDGTCRVSPEICPRNITCPDGRYRCDGTQICVKNKTECYFGLICPFGKTKCSSDGYCTSDISECEPSPIINSNGCLNGGEKCPTGRCMPSLTDCSLINNACPEDDKPFLCSNGECIEDIRKCPIVDNPGECIEGKVRCPTGRCVENNTEIFRYQCSNNIGCPYNKPYRCSNGKCEESERNCDVTTIIENEGSTGTLISNIVCDESKPYLCRDKSCVSDPDFCKSTLGCQEKNQKACYNGYCVDSDSEDGCMKYEGFCPISNPIHCPSGSCVDDFVKCSTSFKIPICSEGEFYCVRVNQCLKKKLDCFIFYDNVFPKKENKTENNNSSRLLYEIDNSFVIDPLSDEDFIKSHKKNNNKKIDMLSFIEENDYTSDSSEQSDSEIEKINGVFCFDGTVASSYKECPIVPACKMGQYRCENGGCAYDKKTCIKDYDYICRNGEKKCPDGLCHKDCSEIFFHGCEVGQYQCTNGQCVQDKYDCIGHSMCLDLTNPFRCMNGDCKSSPEECELIERLSSVKNVSYSFNKMNKIEFSFAYDSNRRPIAKIEIPGNGFDFKSEYSRLHIREIPLSILHDSELYNNSAEFLFNVSNSIYGSEGIINFENSVMSPVFKFYADNNKGDTPKFKLNGTINIVHNEYDDVIGLFYYDYCLAKLKGYNMEKDIIEDKNKKWECVERQTTEKQTEFQLTEFGVYAVILSPSREKVNYFGDSKAKNFFIENVKVILIVLACVIVTIALVFYIFLRVTRYRQKYHENRAKILLLQQQKQEYENMTTDIFGQTLGDNINGIVYKANPAYTVTEEIKKSGTSLEEEIEKLQIECRNVNDQNERLQKDIEEITDKYKSLSNTIENMNK